MRPYDILKWVALVDFNPRTPYGMRLNVTVWSNSDPIFQSTHPLRDATNHIATISSITSISIHAPLTGCDRTSHIHQDSLPYFNPRTPYGMRLFYFQSIGGIFDISIHAPLTGCDELVKVFCKVFGYISIHAPLTGCDYF